MHYLLERAHCAVFWEGDATKHFSVKKRWFFQGRILAVWILAPKLPNSDLKIAVDFWVDFFLLFFPRKKARKNPPKNPRQKIHPGIRSEKFPSDSSAYVWRFKKENPWLASIVCSSDSHPGQKAGAIAPRRTGFKRNRNKLVRYE